MADGNRSRGLLRVASELDVKSHVDTGEIKLPTSGTEGAMAQVSAEFSRVGSKIGAWADHAAALDGAEAGQRAGLDPEFRPRKDRTIFGEAYDKAGLQVYKSRVRMEMADDLEATYDKYGSDPKALAEAYAEKRRGWLNGALPEAHPDLELTFRSETLSGMRKATREQAKRVSAELRAASDGEVQQRMKGVFQKAYAMGVDAIADDVLAEEVGQIARTMVRRGPDGKRLYDPKAAEKLLEGIRTDVATARILGAFERLDTIESKAAFVQKFHDDYAKSEGLARVYSFDKFQHVGGQLDAGLRRAQAGQNAARHALTEDVKSLGKAAEKGHTPSDDNLAGLKARVAAVGDPKLQQQLDEGLTLLNDASVVRTLRPDQLDEAIRTEKARIATDSTPFAERRLTMLEGLRSKMVTGLKDDPLGWANDVNLIKVAPLDFSSPETAAATLKARVAQAHAVGEAYGVTPKYLRPDEKRMLSSAMAEGGDKTIQVAKAIAETVPDNAPAILSEISKQGPGVALIGSLVVNAGGTVPTIAQDASVGLGLRKTQGYVSTIPKGTKSDEAVRDVLGAALRGNPEWAAAVRTVADAAYEARAARISVGGKGDFDADLYKQTLREALGERDIGGQKFGGIVKQGDWYGWLGSNPIVLPSYVKQSTWKDTIGAIEPADLDRAGLGKPVDASGKPVSLERIKNATLVQYGPDAYVLATGDANRPGGERWIFRDKPGQPFVLDMGKLSPEIARRRPDLFAGGR